MNNEKTNEIENNITKVYKTQQKIYEMNYPLCLQIQSTSQEILEKCTVLQNRIQQNPIFNIQKSDDFSDVVKKLDAVNKVIRSSDFQDTIKHLTANENLIESIALPKYMESAIALEQSVNKFITSPLFSHITEIYKILPLDVTKQYTEFFEQIPKESLNNMTNNVSAEDIFNVDISEDCSLTYEGETYSKDEIIKQLQIEIRQLQIENRELKIELQEEKLNTSEHEPQVKQFESKNILKKFDKLKKVCEIVKFIIWIKQNYEPIINTFQDVYELCKLLLMK